MGGIPQLGENIIGVSLKMSEGRGGGGGGGELDLAMTTGIHTKTKAHARNIRPPVTHTIDLTDQ